MYSILDLILLNNEFRNDNILDLPLALGQKPYLYNDKRMSLSFGALGPTLGTFIMEMFKDIQWKVDFDERLVTDLNAKVRNAKTIFLFYLSKLSLGKLHFRN